MQKISESCEHHELTSVLVLVLSFILDSKVSGVDFLHVIMGYKEISFYKQLNSYQLFTSFHGGRS